MLSALMALVMFVSVSFAQAVKKEVKQAKATTTAKVVPITKSTTAHTKKDGTLDKRFKENKKAAAVHLKKDGTPDQRFKENKK